jgi:hypothetical protein
MDEAKLFVGDTSGPPEYTAIFEVTDGSEEGAPIGGYLYVTDRSDQRILKHLEIYRDPFLDVKEQDVRIFWSSDGAKCGVAIWGRMRGIINVASGQELAAPLENQASPAITDSDWLVGFESYLDEGQFLEARGRYWRAVARQYKPDLGTEDLPPLKTKFILYDKGVGTQVCVFEDEGDTGYLYLYDSAEQKVLRHLHLYDHPSTLGVSSQDVDVVWSEDYAKCGVIIWGKMRGIIDLKSGQEGRVKLESRDTPGIGDKKWLKGFEYLQDPVTRH